jgi:hypothetical protein
MQDLKREIFIRAGFTEKDGAWWVTSVTLCERWNNKHSDLIKQGKMVKREGPDVREAINHLRSIEGEKIVSCPSGYRLAKTIEEYVRVNQHILSRISEEYRAYIGPIKRAQKENNYELKFRSEEEKNAVALLEEHLGARVMSPDESPHIK